MIGAKIEQAVGILNELDIDAWMLFARESATVHDPSFDLVVGGNCTWQSAFILTRDGERIAVLGSLDVAAHKALGHYTEIVPYVQGVSEPLREVLRRIDPRRIAVNYSLNDEMADGMTHGMYLLLQDILKDTPYAARLESSEGIVGRLRARKLAPELERIARACAETVDLFAQLHRRLRIGLTEKQIAAIMVEIMEAKGLERAWDADHCPAVFTGPESAGAHAGPTDRVMEAGHLMNVDFGMRVEGFCSDLQRTWYCLRPGETGPPAIVTKAFEAVRDGIHQAAAFLRPGVKGHEVDAVARGHIVAQGFDEYPHALGHQIGRQAHDGAGLLCPIWERYGAKPYAVVEQGQCYTLEPRAVVPGYGVATIEEIVVVTADGCRFLSDPQMEIMLVAS
ncbi:MAG TPA: M24 family metallopeptidase [Thermoanaerobaculaceae bacterium]|nr:M24 family metallopeptidase [Thermoanaerobaculaceae bacterium]HRS15770.1 M24 family metallopeptidase [Thermoanaerobaculaceae bacterium]